MKDSILCLSSSELALICTRFGSNKTGSSIGISTSSKEPFSFEYELLDESFHFSIASLHTTVSVEKKS